MNLNVGHSIFPELNDQNGLMICGYEWGFSKEDQRLFDSGKPVFHNETADTTFSNKYPAHGQRALAWKYDNRIIKWFSMWGHPLSRDGLGGDFEKCILQTNWCNTDGHKIRENYHKKLTNHQQLQNFIHHIRTFTPDLIFFMGSEMIKILQDKKVMEMFSEEMGNPKTPPQITQKLFPGRRFKISFQEFEKCKVVSFPHPSSSRGLSDEYISLFSEEMGRLITELKNKKGIKA